MMHGPQNVKFTSRVAGSSYISLKRKCSWLSKSLWNFEHSFDYRSRFLEKIRNCISFIKTAEFTRYPTWRNRLRSKRCWKLQQRYESFVCKGGDCGTDFSVSSFAVCFCHILFVFVIIC